ncbi:MAG TPA: GAF domain-containing sensor histidine kinase [Terriglobia bacterium]|nr:GAF domain-containing sensor histidine kinase [Terriglobia bacterium]
MSLERKEDSVEILFEHVGRLERMLEATKCLSSTLDLVELTEIILRIIRQEVPVDRVTAFMVDRESRILRSVVAQGVGDFVIRIPIGVGIAGAVAQTGEILDVPDAYSDKRFYPAIDSLTDYHTNDILCLPILNRERNIVGVLELLNRDRPITDDDKTFLRDISIHIGLALELAWAHRECLEKQKLEEELRVVRERLVELDRLQLMGELIGCVMHELHNPLAIVVGNVELLKMHLEPGVRSRMSAYLDKIEAAADRSAATVRTFLSFVEAPRRERRQVDLVEVLRQTLALRKYHEIRAGIEVIDDLQKVPVVMANQEEIQEVFLILLKNAEEAVSGRQQEPLITLRSSYNSGSEIVHIDIMDNGRGIPPEAHSRIFEPFFTTKPKGTSTGLSLTIARKVVEGHGGKIWVETKKDVGTTLSIELPA